MPKKTWPMPDMATTGAVSDPSLSKDTFNPKALAKHSTLALPTPPVAAVADASAILGDSGSNEALKAILDATQHIKTLGLLTHLKAALAHLQAKDWKAAGDQAIEALNVDEKNATAWHILAISREKSNDLRSAFSCYEAALRLDQDNIAIANDVGRLAFFMNLHENAEQFFKYVLARVPNHPEAVNNYASSLREMNRCEEAIELLRTALEAMPTNAALWNTLGTVLNVQGDVETALLFFDEALTHDPNNGKSWHNRGLILGALGRYEEAITSLETAIPLFDQESNREASRLAIAFCYLCLSDCPNGWAYYEARKQIHSHEGMRYLIDIPALDPARETFKGLKLFVSAEQGLGDEILFATLLADLIEELGPEGHLTLAVEPRLVALFQRSFPTATVMRHRTVKDGGHQIRHYPDLSDTTGFDGFITMGDLLKRYRNDLDSFEKNRAFLIPDPARVAHWQAELAALGPAPKVGVLWKSLVQHSRRDRFYSPFAQWKHVLQTPGVIFVNLQYGDVSTELAEAESAGMRIWNPPGIDLRQDLDDLCALCKAVDLILGPSNATSNIAAATGTPVWLIVNPGAWPMLGTDRYPWYPSIRCFMSTDLRDWAPVMRELRNALNQSIAKPPEPTEVAAAFKGVERALLMRDWDTAAVLASNLTRLAPDHAGAWHALATAYDRSNALPQALDAYQNALARDPDSLDIAADLAQLAFRIGQYDMAEKFYALVIARDPEHLLAVNYYASALRELSKFSEAIEVLQAYLGQYPRQSDLWNTLGTIVMAQGDLDTALIFFNESLSIDQNLQARFNRACALAEMGDFDTALPDMAACAEGFSEPSNILSTRLTYAQGHLCIGDLKTGWDIYNARHMTGTPSEVHHEVDLPALDPDLPLTGKRVLILAEQGLGDEIMFMTLLPDLIAELGDETRLSLAVEPRLVPLFQRGFPKAQVYAHRTETRDGRIVRHVEGFDAQGHDGWALIGGFLPRLRPTIHAFTDQGPLLPPDPARVAYWRNHLAALGSGLKVGILWKSLKNDSRRQRHYAGLDTWQSVLATPGAVFINLQYGEVSEDLAAAEAAGFKIHNPPLDLMNDLNDLSALCAAVDLVIGPANATSNIAAAAGAETWMMCHPQTWPLLGSDHYPWYPTARVFRPTALNDWESLMAQIKDALMAKL